MIAAKEQLWTTDLNLWTIIKTTGYLLALPSYHSTDHVKADLFQFVFISCSFSCVWLAKILLRLSHYLNNIDLSLKSVALEMFRVYLIYISTFSGSGLNIFWARLSGTLIVPVILCFFFRIILFCFIVLLRIFFFYWPNRIDLSHVRVSLMYRISKFKVLPSQQFSAHARYAFWYVLIALELWHHWG